MSIQLKRVVHAGLLVSAAVAAAIAYSINTFIPANDVYRSSPPLAITGYDLSGGNQTVFQTRFNPNPSVWRGELSAYPISATGQVDPSAVVWRASEKLASQNIDVNLSTDPRNCGANAWQTTGRRIVTRNGSTNIPFLWANLSAAQQASIDGNATTGQNILNFVRGDPKNEKQLLEDPVDGSASSTWPVLNPCSSPTGTFRSRVSVLGDIINGKPVYIGAPPANYTFDGYQTYKSAKLNRAGRVYVGANDGMLHAFNATTGDEVFAYIPSMLISSLKNLKANPYVHTYFVDGGLAAGDANFGSSGAPSWRTVLVGGLGAGGKGLYALDVTDPAAADETAAKAKILWEITTVSTGFADLGFTYGEAAITRLSDGRWAAIAGNGYNNTGSGKSVLYVIDITNGTLIKSITVGTGGPGNPGGLSSPRVIDADSDGKGDFVYAGDIDGKLWKFDIRDASPANWTSSALYDAGATIMGIPDVVPHPLGGLLVYFGTGTLFTKEHGQSKTVQNYAYGIWDGAPAANTAVLEQTLTESLFGSTRVRTSSGFAINWDSDASTKHRGWRTKLPLGEHIVTSGFVRDTRYHFTSYDPTKTTNIPPGDNWIMELDYLNGSSNGNPIFDLSGDGKLNDPDRVTSAGGSPVPGAAGVPIGIFMGGGLFSSPTLALVSSTFSVALFNQNILPKDGPPPACVSACAGVAGGHFDYDVFDTATGGSFKHTHEYDDKYDVVGASFTNASDAAYNMLNPSYTKVNSTSRFMVLISNGDLSPGVTFTVAGKEYAAFKYPNDDIIADVKANGTASKYVYSVNAAPSVKKFQWVMPVDGLTAKDWGQTPAVSRPGLIPSQTGCVKGGTMTNPGLYGENNNGALTVWIIKEIPKGVDVDAIIVPNVPGKPEKGYKVAPTALGESYHLKHYTMFWHSSGSGCYGSSGYNPTPTPDTKTNNGGTRSPGSEDPVTSTGASGGLPAAVSKSENFTPSATYNGKRDVSGTRTTTTNYVDGSQLIVTETVDKRGNVTSTTSKTVPGSTTGGTTTTGAGSRVVTSPQELRNSGKLGRVSWHELIRN